MIDALNVKENLSVYPLSLKTGFYHLAKRLLSLKQRRVTVIKSIVLLMTIGVLVLLITTNLTLTYTKKKTNIESTASPRYATPKYASEIIILPRATMSQNQMEDVRRELDGRKQQVACVCETIEGLNKESRLEAALSNMIIDTEHKLSWCPIYKAASSTWMIYFAALKGALTDLTMDLIRRNLIQVSDIVRQKFQLNKDFSKKMSGTKKFLIVRHPLERLLSAYRDKLEHMQGREYYYKRFGRRITLKYRQPGENATRLEPTFAEFLRFIVKEKHFDEHWAPYYRTCEPCGLHYDYILKLETLDRDQNFLIQDAGLSNYLYEVRLPGNVNPHGATTKEILDEYITGIPRSLLDEIYEIYENDFKLFNYSFI